MRNGDEKNILRKEGGGGAAAAASSDAAQNDGTCGTVALQFEALSLGGGLFC